MATEEGTGLLSISAHRSGDIAADRAVLGVVIEGASWVTGQSALSKAREVKALADALKAFGLAESDIELEGVTASVSSGTFAKSSSARYALRVRVASLESLPDVIGIVTSQKNTTLRSTRWNFPDEGPWRDEWLDSCLQAANARAERIARGLRVPLLGVHRFAESWSDAPPPQLDDDFDGYEVRGAQVAARARVTSDSLSLSASHTKKVSLSIAVQYVVGRFEASR